MVYRLEWYALCSGTGMIRERSGREVYVLRRRKMEERARWVGGAGLRRICVAWWDRLWRGRDFRLGWGELVGGYGGGWVKGVGYSCFF